MAAPKDRKCNVRSVSVSDCKRNVILNGSFPSRPLSRFDWFAGVCITSWRMDPLQLFANDDDDDDVRSGKMLSGRGGDALLTGDGWLIALIIVLSTYTRTIGAATRVILYNQLSRDIELFTRLNPFNTRGTVVTIVSYSFVSEPSSTRLIKFFFVTFLLFVRIVLFKWKLMCI